MNNKNELRRQALKTIGYTNKDASWYIDNEVIPYYYDGCSDCVGDINYDRAVGHGIDAADIDYVETLTNCVVYAVSEENDGDDTMPYFVFYIANPYRDDLGITNDCGIKTEAIVGFNYEEGWLYKEAVVYCSFNECFEEGNYILELDGGEYFDVLSDDRFYGVEESLRDEVLGDELI